MELINVKHRIENTRYGDRLWVEFQFPSALSKYSKLLHLCCEQNTPDIARAIARCMVGDNKLVAEIIYAAIDEVFRLREEHENLRCIIGLDSLYKVCSDENIERNNYLVLDGDGNCKIDGRLLVYHNSGVAYICTDRLIAFDCRFINTFFNAPEVAQCSVYQRLERILLDKSVYIQDYFLTFLGVCRCAYGEKQDGYSVFVCNTFDLSLINNPLRESVMISDKHDSKLRYDAKEVEERKKSGYERFEMFGMTYSAWDKNNDILTLSPDKLSAYQVEYLKWRATHTKFLPDENPSRVKGILQKIDGYIVIVLPIFVGMAPLSPVLFCCVSVLLCVLCLLSRSSVTDTLVQHFTFKRFKRMSLAENYDEDLFM